MGEGRRHGGMEGGVKMAVLTFIMQVFGAREVDTLICDHCDFGSGALLPLYGILVLILIGKSKLSYLVVDMPHRAEKSRSQP